MVRGYSSIPDICAATCADAFLLHWIARYGCPLNATTDRGAQFCSDLFKNFCINFGINLRNTTAYHPVSNGIIENTHRTIKAALKAHKNPLNWYSNLGLVLLGLRSTYKPNIDCSSPELLYETTIRLPGQYFEDFSPKIPQTDYSKQLTEFMSLQRFIPRRRQPAIKSFLDPALDTCSHVFVKVEAKKGLLYLHYDGPFLILEKRPKYFVLLMNEHKNSVSIDRLKVAHLPIVTSNSSNNCSDSLSSADSPTEPLSTQLKNDVDHEPDEPLVFTRRGRQVRCPIRFRY